jgi:hypothetical protein
MVSSSKLLPSHQLDRPIEVAVADLHYFLDLIRLKWQVVPASKYIKDANALLYLNSLLIKQYF